MSQCDIGGSRMQAWIPSAQLTGELRNLGSSEISGNPVPRLTRNRQVVERSEVIGQIEVVIWRGLSYTTRERASGDNGFSLVSYLLG